jgi:hypothetical protein
MEKIRGKGLQLLGGLHQPPQHCIGIDLEDARRAPDTQPLSETRDDAHDEVGRGVFTMKNRAVGLREIPVTGDTLQLTPGLTAGMPISADVATAESAMVETIRSRTEVCARIDSPSATSGERDHGRWRAGRLASCSAPLRTGLAERFVEEPSEGLRLFGALTPGLVELEGPVRCGPGMVGPPDMEHEENQHESDQQELVKHQVRCHDDVLFHGGEKGQFYRIGPLLNYPLHAGTPPEFVDG